MRTIASLLSPESATTSRAEVARTRTLVAGDNKFAIVRIVTEEKIIIPKKTFFIGDADIFLRKTDNFY